MTEQTSKTHWKKNFDYRFVASHELPKDVTVVIESFEQDEAFNGVAKEKVLVLKFKGKKKGMICNRTNAKKITQIAGSPFTEDWIGVQITLSAQMVKVKGEMVEGIRVKNAYKNIQV